MSYGPGVPRGIEQRWYLQLKNYNFLKTSVVRTSFNLIHFSDTIFSQNTKSLFVQKVTKLFFAQLMGIKSRLSTTQSESFQKKTLMLLKYTPRKQNFKRVAKNEVKKLGEDLFA